MSIVASKDGTNLGADSSSGATGTENWIDPTQLTQVAKLIKIDNVHLPLFAICTSGRAGTRLIHGLRFNPTRSALDITRRDLEKLTPQHQTQRLMTQRITV